MDYEYLPEFRELAKVYWKNDKKLIDNFKVSEYNNVMDAGYRKAVK